MICQSTFSKILLTQVDDAVTDPGGAGGGGGVLANCSFSVNSDSASVPLPGAELPVADPGGPRRPSPPSACKK